MSQNTSIQCCGVSHQTANTNIREKLFLSREKIRVLLPYLKRKYKLQEIFIVSTCNRVELYAAAEHNFDLRDVFLDIFSSTCLYVLSVLEPQKLKSITYWYQGQDCYRHFFRTVSSLNSLVIGETQITGQFKSSFELAKSCDAIGTCLNRMFQEGFAVNKKIRSQTAISKGIVAVSHAGIELVRNIYQDFSNLNIAVMGFGEMAISTIQYLEKYSPKHIFIINRSKIAAHRLEGLPQNTSIHTMGEMDEVFVKSQIIVAAAGAKNPIVLPRHLDFKRNNPIAILDVAIPRNVDSECSSLTGVFLFDMDDIQKSVAHHTAARKSAAEKAQKFVKKTVSKFEKWLDFGAQNDAIKQIELDLVELIESEFQKTLSKGSFKTIFSEQKELEQMHGLKDALTRKIKNHLIKALKNQESTTSTEPVSLPPISIQTDPT